jgi:hypothetical protein
MRDRGSLVRRRSATGQHERVISIGRTRGFVIAGIFAMDGKRPGHHATE